MKKDYLMEITRRKAIVINLQIIPGQGNDDLTLLC